MASLVWLDEKEGSSLYNQKFKEKDDNGYINHNIRSNRNNKRYIIGKDNILEERVGL